MIARTRVMLLGLVRLVLAIVVVLLLFYAFLIAISTPIPSPPDDLPETGPAIGWILVPAGYVIAVFVGSIVCGALFPRDRWVVRAAASIPIIGLFFYEILAWAYSPGSGPPWHDSVDLRFFFAPIALAGVVAFVLSPWLHDCGRVSRGYLRHTAH